VSDARLMRFNKSFIHLFIQSYLRSLLDQYTPIRTLRSADQYLFDRLRVNRNFGKRAFSYKAPNIWNNLSHQNCITGLFRRYDTRRRSRKLKCLTDTRTDAQMTKSSLCVSSSTAPTALGIRQEVEQINADVFLLNVYKHYFLPRFLTVASGIVTSCCEILSKCTL